MHDTHLKIKMSFNTRNSSSANIYLQNEILLYLLIGDFEMS